LLLAFNAVTLCSVAFALRRRSAAMLAMFTLDWSFMCDDGSCIDSILADSSLNLMSLNDFIDHDDIFVYQN
jgi:hypothetical protein